MTILAAVVAIFCFSWLTDGLFLSAFTGEVTFFITVVADQRFSFFNWSLASSFRVLRFFFAGTVSYQMALFVAVMTLFGWSFFLFEVAVTSKMTEFIANMALLFRFRSS
jgi:hypothetical protein